MDIRFKDIPHKVTFTFRGYEAVKRSPTSADVYLFPSVEINEGMGMGMGMGNDGTDASSGSSAKGKRAGGKKARDKKARTKGITTRLNVPHNEVCTITNLIAEQYNLLQFEVPHNPYRGLGLFKPRAADHYTKGERYHEK